MSGDEVVGKRVFDKSRKALGALRPGEYMFLDEDGYPKHWFGACPGEMPSGGPIICGLARHTVIEFNDGTISVVPSIHVHGPWEGKQDVTFYHGWLERGVWREA